MNAHEIKKALKGLPHIKTVWVDANGGYYTAPMRGTQILDLTDEIEEASTTNETVENLTQLPPKTATNKRKK
jgi:hypothetical protein